MTEKILLCLAKASMLWRVIFTSFIFFVFSTIQVFASPSITITSIPSEVTADEEFSIGVTLAGLEVNTIYRLKSLGKIDGDDKLKTQSENGQEWLAWNGAWVSMPQMTANGEGSASATVKSKFYDIAQEGADVSIRIRKDSGGDTYDSGTKTITVKPKPSPSPTPTPTPTPSPSPASTPKTSPTPKPTSSTTTLKKSPQPTLEPVAFLEGNSNQKDIELGQTLGESTEASPEATGSGGLTVNRNAIVSWLLTGSGLVFLAAAGVPLLKNHLKAGRTESDSVQ